MTLERLKELSQQATPGPCKVITLEFNEESGDIRYVVEFQGVKSGSVPEARRLEAGINALPALLEVAEAAKWVRETTNHAYVLNQAAVKGALKRLYAALAKLEVEK